MRPVAEQAGGHLREGPRERAARGDEDETFVEQLAEELASAGAEGLTDGELALARGIAREQKHDYVGQRDEEHEADHGHQHVQRVAVLLVVSGESPWLR